MLDFTYTLLVSEINLGILIPLYILTLLIRYCTLACLIYVYANDYTRWGWIIVVFGARIFYLILVMKISLMTAETKTEVILKTHWNSK